MKRAVSILALVFLVLPIVSKAQGGIGTKPRDDIYMLSASVHDSLSGEVFARIQDLQRYIATKNMDSALSLIAFNGGKTNASGKWARAINPADNEERARAQSLIDKLDKLTQEMPEMHREYYAVFKDKDNPAGQKHLYQISFTNGAKKKRMVSFTFYPVGDRMLLGDIG